MKKIFNLILCTFIVVSFNHVTVAIEQPDLPIFDISEETERHVVIAAGTPDRYYGHPNSVLLPDGKTILIAWCINHGGSVGPMARSNDGGKTWTRTDDLIPKHFAENYGNPMMFRMVTEKGIEHLWIFARPWIARILSKDEGKTWKELEPLGLPNVLPFTAIVSKNPEKQDGKYIGFYTWQLDAEGKVMNGEGGHGPMQIIQTETNDAGLTWSKARVIAAVDGLSLLEGFAFWSPDNKELCCLMRENGHQGRSRMMFSYDNGTTWSEPVETSWGLTGDRHVGIVLPDHRFVFAFRDRAINSPTYGHFVCWVGTYEDIKKNKPGQFRVKLLHSYAGVDCGYPGLHLLPDGTILAITYIKHKPDNNKQSIVGTRFRLTKEGVENLQKEQNILY